MFDFIKKENKQLIGYVSPKFFDKIPEKDKLKFRTWHFIAKPNVLPSDALKAAIKGLSIIDCGMACQIARYGALLDILEENKFNLLFSKNVLGLINIGHRDSDHLQPMRYFVDFTKAVDKNIVGEIGNRPVKIGQVVGFEGVKNYTFKYPYGQWKASNAICINDTPGEQKFVSLGTGPEGKTEAEICQNLLDNYNKHEEDLFIMAPQGDKMVDHTNKMISLFGKEAMNSSMKNLFPLATKVEGYNSQTPQDFIVEIINDLIKLPLEQISIDFVKNHPANSNRIEDI